MHVIRYNCHCIVLSFYLIVENDVNGSGVNNNS